MNPNVPFSAKQLRGQSLVPEKFTGPRISLFNEKVIELGIMICKDKNGHKSEN